MTHTHPSSDAASSSIHTHGNVIHWAKHYDRVMALFSRGLDDTLAKGPLAARWHWPP